ncbi:MAG: hypothetical protein MJZ25_07940 [Fibrobacter sp.]|nr:hypothetical protein [Fibrobacter sp.]
MMRNGINSYLTSLVMVLALLFSANAFAAETVQSTIEIDGKDYTLFTGFTATAGIEKPKVTTALHSNMVDGDPSTSWRDARSDEAVSFGYTYVEFTSDVPIFLKGYILNSYSVNSYHPSEWRLFAKADVDGDYVLVSEYTDQTYSGTEHKYPVVNEENNQYRFFRFECANENLIIALTEIRLYGYDELTYTHLTPHAATCSQQGVLRECYLRNDGKYFTDETGTTELDEFAVVEPMIPHIDVHHEADANHIEYWQCSVCGKFFADAEMTTEIAEVQTQKIKYLNSTGDLEQLNEVATKVTSDATIWNAGWYLVSENVTISDRIIVNGEVHLILANGVTLNANRGITVSTDASFNIYAQTEDEANMGALNATVPNYLFEPYAGIGCAYGSGDAGSIMINGGKITARGNEGAGIGSVQYRSVGTITINGGIVDAADTEGSGAGIGSGKSGKASVINLNGGVIYAKGIGAGVYGTGSITINVSNGIKKIVATSNNSGCIGNKENITVNFKNEGSIVTGAAKDAIFYDSGEGEQRIIRTKALNHHIVIGDNIKAHITADTEYALAGELITLTVGLTVDASSVKINGVTGSLSDVEGGTYTFVMPDGDVNVAVDEVAETYSVDFPEQMEIVRTSNPADGDGKYISGTVVEFRLMFPYTTTDVSDGTNTLVAANGVYSVTVETSNINISASINRGNSINLSEATNNFTAVDGDVLSGSTQYTVMVADMANITLSDATIDGGIICDGSATITLEGENNVTGATNMAGIQVGGLGTTLTIRGDGSLTALGNYFSAGIGLSQARKVDAIGGDIVIEGGNITAIGHSKWGSGIGTGEAYKATVRLGNITIKGGVVKAIGGEDADGIGIGYTYTNLGSTNEIGTITIYDTADMVDASSVRKNIIYMHDDIDVSVSKNDYFGIIENGERKIIYTGIPAFDVEDQTYTGEAITPKPTVSLGSLNFEEGTDYEYSYTNNVNVGSSATVTVTFKGDYAEFGSVSKSFNITKATPTVEPPTSANPKYTGTCVALVTAGSTNFGTMLYSVLREGGSQTAYYTGIPCADWAGRYTVYYKVEESDNWFGFAPQSVDVTVENEMFKITFVDDEGDEIISREYEYGTPAEGVDLPPENPEKADDEMYAYTFAGWSPEIQEVTGAMTYSPIYDKTRIGFGPITIAKDSSSAIIDGMSRDPIDKAIKDCMIKGEVTLYRHFAAGKYSTLVLPFSTFTGAFSGVSFYSFRGVEKENGVWKTVVFGYVDKENEGNKPIEANTPYIVVADADMDDLVVKDGVLFDADDPKSSYGATLICSEETCDEVPDENKSWQFVGTYNYRQWDSGNNVEEIGTTYGFAGAAGNGGMEIGKFGKIKEGAYIYPMRAYLRYQPPSLPSVLFKAAPAYASVASIDELPESMDVVIRGEEGTTVIGTINTRTGEFRSADNRWFDLNGRYLGNKKPTVKGTYYNNGKKVIVK